MGMRIQRDSRRLIFLLFAIAMLLVPTRAEAAVTDHPALTVVANLHAPFVFQRDGKLVGFDVDLVNMIASINGWDVRYELTTFPEELNRIENGTADLGIGSIFWTRSRADHFAFTNAYLYSGPVILVRTGSTITGPEDLNNHTVAVNIGTTSEDYVLRLKERYPGLGIVRLSTPEELFRALAAGKVDAAVHDYANAHYFINSLYQGTIVVLRSNSLNPFPEGRYPLAYPAARSMLPLLGQFNTTMSELHSSGVIAKLEAKWFDTGSIPLLTGIPQKILFLIVLAIILSTATVLLLTRERAVRAAQEQARHYHQLFAAIPEPALLASDVRGILQIEAVNNALCLLLERSEESLLKTPVDAILHADAQDKSKTLTWLLEESATASRWQLQAPDEIIPVEIKTSFMHGTDHYVFIVARDLREQLKAERSIQKAYEQYHALFDEAPDPVIIINNHVITHANHAMEALLGLSVEELIGKQFSDLSPLQQPDGTTSSVEAAVAEDRAAEGVTQHFNWVFRTTSGDSAICTVSLRSVTSAGGAVLQGIFHDITKEEQAKEHNRQLERELMESQKMEAVGRLAGGIAHDFNNIMGGIIGHASLLKADAPEGTNLYEGLATIELAARRAAELTHRLLTFSRKEKATIAEVNMRDVLDDTLAIAMPSFDKRVALVKKIAPDLNCVAGDRTQLEEAFLNLVVNARDALGHANGTLTVDASNFSVGTTSGSGSGLPNLTSGSYVRISITDTGCGISPEVKEHLFEPFFTTRADGTGMGLSIVWRVVHDHGGTVQVESTVGQGTTFTLYFPAIPSSQEKTSERLPAAMALPRALHKEQILVVDDEEVVRTVAVKALANLGYRVLDVADPVEALALYQQSWSSIDLVLIDMMMPRMNGEELLDHMHAINPSVRAILMSGYGASDATASSCFVAFIPKPYTLEELAVQVRHSLDATCSPTDAAAGELRS